MIVQCEHCQTKYRIADEKVKGKGAKVRCAKCENVFTVTAPEEPAAAPPAPPEPPAPQPAPEPEPPSTQPPASDLTAPEPPAPDPVEQSADLPPLGEPSPSAPAEQPSAPSSEPEQPLGGYEPPVPGTGLDDLAAPATGRPAHEQDRGVEGQPSVGEEAGLSDPGGFELEGTMREGTDDAGLPGDLGGLGGDDPGGLPDISQPSAQPEGGDGTWGNISIGDGSPDSAGEDLGIASPPDYVPPPPVEESVDSVPEPFPTPAEPAAPSTAPAHEAQPPSRRGRKGIVLLLLLAALGAGGYFYYPSIHSMVMEYVKPGPQEAAGTLVPASIKVQSLSRAGGQALYTVRGEVRNESAGTVGMIQVEAQFRNKAGDVIARSRSFCGNLFDDNELATGDIDRIRGDLGNELGQSLSNASIPPGSSVPFLIVVENPPEGVDKVTVTISSFQETT